MDQTQFRENVQKLVELIGLYEASLDVDFENRKIALYVNEGPWFEKWVPRLVHDLEHLVRLVAKRAQGDYFYLDINNYRKERERLIVELAKAAARKAVTSKEAVRLPVMNAYERRLVHVELAVHPEVTTESEGEGGERCVIVKLVSS